MTGHKKAFTALAASAIILLSAACGKEETPPQPSTPSPATQTSEISETRMVEHLKGTAEIPADIDRIVVLSAAYIDHLLTIGEKPYGVNTEVRYGGDYLPYMSEALAGVQTVGSADSPNLEAIASLEPDVILIESRTAETTFEQLDKIAPTIVLGNEWLDYEEDPDFWTKDLLTIADMYGKTELAESKIAELAAKVEHAAEAVKALDNRKLAYLRVREKLLQIYSEKGHPTNTLLYRELGFEPASLTPLEQREDLSLEVITELDSDHIVLEVDPNGRDLLVGMNDSALWNAVPAVQDGSVYETDSFWLFKGWGAIGRGRIVDEVLRMIQ